MFTEKQVAQLLKRGDEEMEVVREVYAYASEQYHGSWFNACETRKKKRRPYSLIGQQISVLHPNLTGHRMSAKFTARRTSLTMAARIKSALVTQHLERLRFAQTDARAVLDAMLAGIGTLKIGIRESARQFQLDDRAMDIGELTVKLISPNDLILDPHPFGGDIRTSRIIGDVYIVDRAAFIDAIERMEWDEARKSKTIDAINKCKKVKDSETARKGSENKGVPEPDDETAPGDLVAVCDVTLFDGDTTQIGMFSDPRGDSDGFWIIEPEPAEIPERGLYEHYTLMDVPHKSRGLAPAAQIMELHIALSDVASKVHERIMKARRVYQGDPAGRDQAKDVVEGKDQEIIFSKAAITAADFGGKIEDFVPGFNFLQDLANQMGPNMALIGGREDPSGTATGSAIVDKWASTQVSDWRERCQATRSCVLQRLSWWDDLQTERQVVTLALPGGPEDVEVSPDDREGTYADFDAVMRVTTAQQLEPAARLMRFNEGMASLATNLQLVAMMGGNIDKFLAMYSDMMNMPEFDEMLPSEAAAVVEQALQQHQQLQAMARSGGGRPGAGAGGGGRPSVAGPRRMIDQRQSDMKSMGGMGAGVY